MSNKDQQIAALKEKVAEQEALIGELVRHQARVTGRSVEEYFDALKARELVEALQCLLDRATAKVLKLQRRRDNLKGYGDDAYRLLGLAMDANKQFEEANMWIPVSEALPKDQGIGYLVVTTSTFNGMCFGYYEDSEGWTVDINGIDSPQPAEVTHWRPLPAPPEKESEVGDDN